MNQYDYIIAGSGAAGLALAYRMSQDHYFDDKNILLIDKNIKNTNDRTWCYWEKGVGEWDHLVFKNWNHIYFGSKYFSAEIGLGAYQYKMIRSDEFYTFIFNTLQTKSNFNIIIDEILDITDIGSLVNVKTKENLYISKKLFNSIFNPIIITKKPQFPYLKQHFIGWFIQTKKDYFKEDRATFMDFGVEQKGNTRFMYLLPTSTKDALIEYTLFSKDVLPKEEYENEIQNYISSLGIESYTIIEKEMGNIPMTCFPFELQNTKNILNIGSAGGWTKASTGYTFLNTSHKTKALLSFVKQNDDYTKFSKRTKYWCYDLIFLEVLNRNNALGSSIFSSIFKNNKIEKIFTFLDEEGTIFDDLRILFNTKPKMAFIQAAISNLRKLFFDK